MYTLFIMIPFLAFAAYMYTKNMKKMGNWEESMAHYRASQLGQRVNMQLVNGDPNFNVATTNVASIATKVKGSKYDSEFHMQMVGQPYGHQTDFSIDYCVESGFSGTTSMYYGAIHITSNARVPRFEIFRKMGVGGSLGLTADANNAVQRVYDDARLPVGQFGDAMLDQRYTIESEDPHLPRQIAQALQVFGTLDFIHIYQRDGGVTFRASTTMQNMTWMNFEQVLYGLACVVCAIEGQPMPAQMAVPTRPGLPAQPPMGAAPAMPAPAGAYGQPGPLTPMNGAPLPYPPQGQPAAPQPGMSQPPPQQYGAPPQQYGAPPQQYGAPPQPGMSQPPPQQYGAPPGQPGYPQQPQQGMSQPPQQYGAPSGGPPGGYYPPRQQ